jgi:hypothetical protein
LAYDRAVTVDDHEALLGFSVVGFAAANAIDEPGAPITPFRATAGERVRLIDVGPDRSCTVWESAAAGPESNAAGPNNGWPSTGLGRLGLASSQTVAMMRRAEYDGNVPGKRPAEALPRPVWYG